MDHKAKKAEFLKLGRIQNENMSMIFFSNKTLNAMGYEISPLDYLTLFNHSMGMVICTKIGRAEIESIWQDLKRPFF